jgi:hypothetical protein
VPTHHQKLAAALASNEVKVIDLAKYGSPGIGVFSGWDRGRLVRSACAIKDGDRVALHAPDYVFALCAGFPDALLRDTRIVFVSDCIRAAVLGTLTRHRVGFVYEPDARSAPKLKCECGHIAALHRYDGTGARPCAAKGCECSAWKPSTPERSDG